ncbi:MAG: flavodoxin family protein [Ghiorsea sp.]|nr:flavodoxin family protein [Ghiorsea sp.]
MQVLIAYHSDYQQTQAVADAVAAGANAALLDAGATNHTLLKHVSDVSLDDLRDADVLIFGSPVHMGSMAWPMKKLIDTASKLWMSGDLEGKIGGVFATYGGFGGAGGGVEQTLVSLHANFLQHGLLVCGFPRSLSGFADAGIHWGLAVRTGNDEGMPEGVADAALVAARAYGAHVVETAFDFNT